MLKGSAYFFLGFLAGLVIVELTDGVPANKVNYYTNDQYMVRYVYRPFPSHYYHHRMQPDTFNNQRPNNQGNSRVETTGRSHSGNTFNHTAQERTESWGNKN